MTFDCQERLHALISHYGTMVTRGLMPLIRAAAKQPLALAGFSGKSGISFELALLATNTLDREGESVLR